MDPVVGHYLSRAKDLESGGLPAWLARARALALERFSQLGFPGSDHEDWRATNVAPIAAIPFEPARRAPLAPEDFERLVPRALRELAGPRLVFVNGYLDERLSRLAAGADLEVASLGSLLASAPGTLEPYFAAGGPQGGKAFSALNTALFRDGAFVLVRGSAPEPIQILHVSVPGAAPVFSAPRNLVLVGERARAQLVETYLGAEGTTFADAVTEIRLGDDATLEHYRLERESVTAFHAGHTSVEQARGSRYASFSVADGGALARHDLEILLAGEGSSCSLDGLSLTSGKQLIDHHTFVDHAVPRCTSEETYKAILDGKSRAVFHGRVKVRAGAQKTDARQSNKSLLLSGEALSNAKPQLEIHADDVKCTHGAAVGQLSAEALFYLRARGIGEAEARALLTEAFAGEVLAKMPLAPVRDLLQAALREKLLGRQP